MRSIACILILLFVTSCGRQAREIVEKSKPKRVSNPTPTPDTGEKPISTDLKWTVPESWKAVPNTGPLRTTKYEVSPKPGATVHISITPLRGTAGGPLANTNRWRRQIGLPAITESQLAKISNWIDVPVGKARVVDVAGLTDDAKSESVIHAAMISNKQRTWFIKMVGLRKTVNDTMKEEFKGFVRTFRQE